MKRQVKTSARRPSANLSVVRVARLVVAMLIFSAWVAWILYQRLGGPWQLWAVFSLLPGGALAYLFDRSTVARVAIPIGVAGSLWRDVQGNWLLELGAAFWLVGGGLTTFLVLRRSAAYILPLVSPASELENLRLLLRFLGRDPQPTPSFAVRPEKLPTSLKTLGLAFLPSHQALAVRVGKDLRGRGPGLVWLPPKAIVLSLFDLRMHEQRAENIKATTRDGIPVQTSLTLTFCIRRAERPEHSAYPFPYDEHAIAEAYYATTIGEANQEHLWYARVRPQAIAHLVDALSRHTLNELYALNQRQQEPLRDIGQNIRVMLEDEFLHQGVEIVSVTIGRLLIPPSVLDRRLAQWKEAWNSAIKERQATTPAARRSWARPVVRRLVRHTALRVSPAAAPLRQVAVESLALRLLTFIVMVLALFVYLLVGRAIEKTNLLGPPTWLQSIFQDYALLSFMTPLTFVAQLFNWHVLRHLIPLAAGWWVGHYLIAHVLRTLYDLPDSATADAYLQHLSSGTKQKRPLKRDTFEAERGSSPLLRLGGPGSIIVAEGDVAITELNGQFSRALGNGEHKLNRFEAVRAILDLREQRRSQRDVIITTREGLEIKTDVHVLFRISQGDESPGRNNPFPFDPESARRAAYAERVLEGGQIMTWDSYPLHITLEALTNLAVKLLLDEIIDPNRRYGPDFDPHISLQDQTYKSAERDLRDFGIQLLGVDIRAFELPEAVQETLVRYWQTFPDPLQNSGPGGSSQTDPSTWWARPSDNLGDNPP